jgi:energy-coupling factor transporter transmembrane protein EcfT
MSPFIIFILVLLTPLLLIIMGFLIVFAPFMIPGILVIIVLFFPLLIILAILGFMGYHTWKPLKFILIVGVPIIIILGVVTMVLKIRPFAKIKEKQKEISADMKAQTALKEDIIHKSVPKTWASPILTLNDDSSTTSTPTPTSTVTTKPYLYDGLVSDIRPGDIVTQKVSNVTAVVDTIDTGTKKNEFTLKDVKPANASFNTTDEVIFTRKEIASDAVGDLNKPPSLPNNYKILTEGKLCSEEEGYIHLSEKECKQINTKQLFSESSRTEYEVGNQTTEPSFVGTYADNRQIQGCSVKMSDVKKKKNGQVYFNTSDHKYYRYTQKEYSTNKNIANICKIEPPSAIPSTTIDYMSAIGCTDANTGVACEANFNNPTTTPENEMKTLGDFAKFLGVTETELKTFDKNLQKSALQEKGITSKIIINRLGIVIKNATTTS